MDIITMDAETFFSSDYTLSSLTTEEYVRNERFECHGWAIRMPNVKTFWLDHLQFYAWAETIDWSQTAVLCHHAHFDGLILSHHYGVVPALYLDTYSMARALLGTHISKGLESLAKEFGLGAKTIPYDLFKGKHWHELSEQVRQQVARGACDDVSLTWDLFQKLAAGFPKNEYAIVDATVRMFTCPRLVGNTELLGQIWQAEERKKQQLLSNFIADFADHPEIRKLKNQDPEELIRKDWVFATLLRANGIEPLQKRMKDGKCKVCKGTGEVLIEPVTQNPLTQTCPECEGKGEVERFKYAFAKTDDFMRELEDHEDEDVQLITKAKLAAHSNGTQTRTYRLGWMSTRGDMTVYLNYCGTHLKGWSGGDKVNWQNFRRNGPIAQAIEAPKGWKVVVADASQVECRLLNKIAGQEDVIERFRNREDPYVNLASIFYGETIYKPKPGDPRQQEMEEKRGTGKQGELSCGYGAGDKTIQATAKKGLYGPPVYLSDEDSRRLKDTYRDTHTHVVMHWKDASDVLKKIHAGMEFEWGPMYIKDKRMWLPNGLPVIYDTLTWQDDPDDGGDAGWRVRVNKNGWSRMYGSKLVENEIQALRNVLIREAWTRCRAAGLDFVSMEHDKLIAIVREHEAEAAFTFLRDEMSRPPTWLPGVPLDSEGYISDTFAKPEK